RTGMPMSPVAYGASAIANATVSATRSVAAVRCLGSERAVNATLLIEGSWLSPSPSQPLEQVGAHQFLTARTHPALSWGPRRASRIEGWDQSARTPRNRS